MSHSESLLPEFDHEMANTRKTLARIPADKLAWKAHPKSNSIGWVGMHLAELPGWVNDVMSADQFDVAPPGKEPYRTPPATTVEDMLQRFDRNVAAARATLAATSDAQFMQPWSLLAGGAVLFTMPRAAVVRSFVLNHMIHHRGILSVYLRLNDAPVPALYGPSGDEEGP